MPAPYWTTYPEAITLAGGVPVEVVRRRDHRVPGHRRAAGGGPHRPHQGAAVRARRRNPTGAVYPPRAGRGDRPVGRRARPVGASPTRSTSTWSTAAPSSARCRCGARAGRHLRRAQRRGQDLRDDRLAGRLADRPGRRGQGRDQPPVARHLQRRQRGPGGGAGRGRRGDLSAVAQMRAAFDRRRQTMVRMLNEIPGVVCPEPSGAFYAYPSVKGLLGKALRGSGRRAPSSWPRSSWTRSRSRSSPARSSP